MLNGKNLIILLIVGLKKMSEDFPKPYKCLRGNNNVKVDLSNYATETDLKTVTGFDTRCINSCGIL